jgi:hypothetical protein
MHPKLKMALGALSAGVLMTTGLLVASPAQAITPGIA